MNLPSALNGDRFVRETIDGETIILDTVSGRLLLLRETAPLILAILSTGSAPEALMQEISNRYGAEAETQTGHFVAKLTELGVLVIDKTRETSSIAKVAETVNWPSKFAPPVVEVYDDIADIITMDPIHDVDADSGWPRAAAATSRE